MGTFKGVFFSLWYFAPVFAPRSLGSLSFLCFPLGWDFEFNRNYLISDGKIKPQSDGKSQATLQHLTASLPESIWTPGCWWLISPPLCCALLLCYRVKTVVLLDFLIIEKRKEKKGYLMIPLEALNIPVKAVWIHIVITGEWAGGCECVNLFSRQTSIQTCVSVCVCVLPVHFDLLVWVCVCGQFTLQVGLVSFLLVAKTLLTTNVLQSYSFLPPHPSPPT